MYPVAPVAGFAHAAASTKEDVGQRLEEVAEPLGRALLSSSGAVFAGLLEREKNAAEGRR